MWLPILFVAFLFCLGLFFWPLFAFFDYQYPAISHYKFMTTAALGFGGVYCRWFSGDRAALGFKTAENIHFFLLVIMFFAALRGEVSEYFLIAGLLVSFSLFKYFQKSKLKEYVMGEYYLAGIFCLLITFPVLLMNPTTHEQVRVISCGVFQGYGLSLCIAGLYHYLDDQPLKRGEKARECRHYQKMKRYSLFTAWLLPFSVLLGIRSFVVFSGVSSFSLSLYIRVAVVFIHALLFVSVFMRLRRNKLSRTVLGAVLFGTCGISMYAFGRVFASHWLHLYLVGCLGFAAIIVVAEALAGPNFQLMKKIEEQSMIYWASGLVFVGAFTRGTAHLMPTTYVSHLGYAAISVFGGLFFFLWKVTMARNTKVDDGN